MNSHEIYTYDKNYLLGELFPGESIDGHASYDCSPVYFWKWIKQYTIPFFFKSISLWISLELLDTGTLCCSFLAPTVWQAGRSGFSRCLQLGDLEGVAPSSFVTPVFWCVGNNVTTLLLSPPAAWWAGVLQLFLLPLFNKFWVLVPWLRGMRSWTPESE